MKLVKTYAYHLRAVTRLVHAARAVHKLLNVHIMQQRVAYYLLSTRLGDKPRVFHVNVEAGVFRWIK